MYTCPVCGYDKLNRPAADHLICSCCGVQFGYEDAGPLPPTDYHYGLRMKWIRRGAQWFSVATEKPAGWNPWVQMAEAGLYYELEPAIEVRLTA